ncbi:MAG: polysaccharide deacetylase family protein [Kouleothrix sp.]|nr:polysaccharide deacetylase family protein [Kouleothrix sp.]
MRQTIAPFQISIGPRTIGDAYPVRARFDRAETPAELLLPGGVLDLAARLGQAGGAAPLGDPAALGRALGRALFTPAIRDLLLRAAKDAAQAGARLQLQLQISPTELAALPWEWVTVGVTRAWSPALRDDYALVRVGRGPRPAAPTPLAGPLCILAIGAANEALQLSALETALDDAARAGRVELRVLRDPAPAAIERALMDGPVHILHCAAPVALTERGAPRLLLRREGEPLDLSGLLADARGLRLVTLAGPQGDASSIGVAAPTLATTLLSAELPATIAFCGALPARLSARFAAACYGQLAAGLPVDLAVTAGRRALVEDGAGRGWGMAQLRLLPGGEQLFAFRAPPRRAPARLPRSLILAGAGAALVGAVLLGARAIGVGAPPLSPAQAQSGLGAGQATPPLQAGDPAMVLPSGLPPALLDTPTAVPSATPAQPVAPGDIPAPTGYATYLTQPDDTLDGIASRMGSEPAAIATLNMLDPRAPLRADRPLVIPVYQPGEAGAGGLVIRRGNPAERKVALTFDIEIDDVTLYGILDVLRARGLRGTFFVTGRWVQAFPDAARAIVRDGHEIGNHSLTHPFFSRIGLNGAAAELEQSERIIKETTGVTARPFFRFPYGDYTADTAALVAREGYVAYHWSADDSAIPGWLDWAAQHPSEANGGILLMHGRHGTIEAMPGWLDRLAALGLQPATLGETLR